jgi:hypothetical protein
MVRYLSPRLLLYSSIGITIPSDAFQDTAAELGTADICVNILGDTKHILNECDIFRPVVGVPHEVVTVKFIKKKNIYIYPSVNTSGQQQRCFSFTQIFIDLSLL